MTTGNSEGSSAQGTNFATSVIQVTNIAPQATRDQMYTFFSFVGQVDDVRLYPAMRDASISITSRTCFVRFADPASVTITLHLNNTVFIDRAIIITPVIGNKVPEENEGLVMAMQIQQQQQQGGVGVSGTGVLGGARGANNDARILAANPGLISMQPSGKIATPDAALDDAGLPPYPLLPETTPVAKVEEIRRTITVAGLDTTVSAQQCMEFFAENAGEVKYFRYCTRDHDHTKYALIEFSERASVASALNLNDRQLGTAIIKVIHSTESINKPQAKSNEAAVKEIEEAMSKVTEASHLVSAAVDPLMGMLAGSAVSAGVGMSGAGLTGSGRSSMARSRSRSRRRSRSRDRDYRSRHRSRSRSRRRSKSRDRGSRRDRRRSRSRSRDRKRSSRHRSRSKESRKERKRSRSRDKKRSRRSRSRDREKEARSSENGTEVVSDHNGDGTAMKKDADHDLIDGMEQESKAVSKRRSRSKSPSRRKKSKSKDRGERKKRSRSRSKERRSHRRGSRSKSRERRKRSRSKDKSSSKKSSRHRSRSRDRDRSDRKRSRSKERDRDTRGNYAKEGRSLRERSPDHKGESRVIRDYDQEEAGFESSGDIKDQEYNNYNGKSRDNRLTTVHEDTREAMGTEDMEISNSP